MYASVRTTVPPVTSSFILGRAVRLTGAFLAGAAMLVVAEGLPAGASTVPPWSVAASANALSTQPNNLNGISCISSVECVAVGSYNNGTAGQTLVEAWNGSTWTVASSPNTSPNQGNDLRGISCTSATNCVAVGSYYNGTAQQTLVEAWNGSTWSIEASPNTSPNQDNLLAAVSCVSSTHCVAVGSYYNGTTDQTLIATWNGSNWSIASSPNAASPNGNDLYGVSCTSSTACVAVGFYHGTTDQALVETWDGSKWTIASTPILSPAGDNYLNDVSCSSTTACVAVGHHFNGTNDQTLIATLMGTTWSIAASPNTSPLQNNQLTGVSCTSPTDCVTVGSYSNGTTTQTLIEIWDGTTWSVSASPNTSANQDNVLASVSCTSSTVCASVGHYANGAKDQTLVVTWDGATWTMAVSANTSNTQTNVVRSVSCAMLTACSAVGNSIDGTKLQTLVLDGAAGNLPPIIPAAGGYTLAASDGGVFAFGDDGFFGSAGGLSLNAPIVALAAMTSGKGYWLTTSSGAIFSFGDASFFGSAGALTLNKPIVGMATTPSGQGYWLVASDGGIFSYGDAVFSGSTGALTLNKPIVGMAATPSGQGYWLVASDGGIFSYGDASFLGSTGALTLNKPVVGMAVS